MMKTNKWEASYSLEFLEWEFSLPSFFRDFDVDKETADLGAILKETRPQDIERGMYDNRELANRNTPRLNRYIKKMQTLFENAGGKWEFLPPEPGAEKYWEMANESGIILES